ncbi:lysine N(6)-hydroxylase/L-ornithine N(5)-oxygenase family protein [Thalassobacillus pellis]|uniref:lysine N(6)-hydroxylase/L-ornithine N(5)-oxygenase family protein n=1 Tax=Thalassobacillus pellis TaxID=748008 RepID=UPI0019611392|nr:lysine N(6)-hydroxylase/L-ornithine N(5)-oxygenase family protein [Thalassobacillus pellis]MBM7553690.1 lysine N6-hydroxylase [Thalassobacillus pellis]
MPTAAKTSEKIFDVIGVGLGPFNLGLAALVDDIPDLDALFLEKKHHFDWHPGMLLEGTTLQVPFLADLVSMVDVTSEYSFLNYLQEHDRLYQFYFFEKFHIPRKEYNHYCQWVSRQLNSCCFGMEVEEVSCHRFENGEEVYEVKVLQASGSPIVYLARNLILGIGSAPNVPSAFRESIGDTVFHSADYLNKKTAVTEAESIAVIGSGQSAAEVFLDLFKEQEAVGYSLEWFTRSKGFFPMEYSKLGLEHFSPDYTKFFYDLPQHKKDELLNDQDLLYKGISADTIAEIYDLFYERSIGNQRPYTHLQAMSEIKAIERKGDTWKLSGWHNVQQEPFETEAEAVILGTGYKPAIPTFLSPLYNNISFDEHGRFKVQEDYRLNMETGSSSIFIQNGEIHTHGAGAPDLGLGAYRNAVIINTLTRREVYRVHHNNIYQTFGVPREKHIFPNGGRDRYAIYE